MHILSLKLMSREFNADGSHGRLPEINTCNLCPGDRSYEAQFLKRSRDLLPKYTHFTAVA
jgi:hypothetical protein